MKIIKSNTYNVISTEPFDLPLPLEFELMCGNAKLAAYSIDEDMSVDYRFSVVANEKILTSTARALDIRDIYFLFSSRVFQDKTPFTAGELARFGLEDYNPYDILQKTHGIIPGDRYWIRFIKEGEEPLSYKKAMAEFSQFFMPPFGTKQSESRDVAGSREDAARSVSECDCQECPDCIDKDTVYSLESIMNQKSHEYTSINDIGSILNESKLDVESLAANITDTTITESAFSTGRPKEKSMVGLTEASEPSSGGGNMSPEAIAALLAGAGGADETPEPTPTPEPVPTSSGGNMSPEAIAALLAGAGDADETPELEPEPTPVPEPTPEPEPIAEAAPTPAPASSGGNMSPEAIAALLAGASGADETPEPEPIAEAAPAPAPTSSGDKMSPEAIAALLASANNSDDTNDEA